MKVDIQKVAKQIAARKFGFPLPLKRFVSVFGHREVAEF